MSFATPRSFFNLDDIETAAASSADIFLFFDLPMTERHSPDGRHRPGLCGRESELTNLDGHSAWGPNFGA